MFTRIKGPEVVIGSQKHQDEALRLSLCSDGELFFETQLPLKVAN